MRERFPNHQVFISDFYVSDYTNYQGSEEVPVRGVDIVQEIPALMEVWPALHFHNPNNVQVMVANMEKNPSLCKYSNGKMCKQCECLCISEADSDNDRPWFALVELKCCEKEETIESNLQSATVKLKKHHKLLRDEKRVIINGAYRYYWVFSIPTINRPPFSSFIWTQEYRLDISENYDGALIIGDNEIEIVDGYIIKGTN